MKNLSLLLLFIPLVSFGQEFNERYKLYSTVNMWTFLKLDTSNGLIQQLQYDIEGNNQYITTIVKPRIDKKDESIGRFELYPTENMYNFLLLDQYNGLLWQIQWSLDEKNRGIVHYFYGNNEEKFPQHMLDDNEFGSKKDSIN